MRKNFIGWSTTTASWILSLSVLSMQNTLLTPSANAQAIVEETSQKIDIVGTHVVEGDQVILRVIVNDEAGRPNLSLDESDFLVNVDGRELPSYSLAQPGEATPPEAWVIVLLDLSGSMDRDDASGQRKLDGATNAIETFIQSLGSRAGKTQVSVVPFGLGRGNCRGYTVDSSTLDNFLAANSEELKDEIDSMGRGDNLCASTDLYSPLISATNFLSDLDDSQADSAESGAEPQPRLSVILLSDGYHSRPDIIEESDALTELESILLRKPNITIHTLGYGFTPEQLQRKYSLSRPADILHVLSGRVKPEDFVDRDALAEIASLSGGIAEFGGDAEQISQNLQIFLDALLGEYEIDFTEPNPERSARREVTVTVLSDFFNTSDTEHYITYGPGREVPLSTRIGILSMTLVALGAGGGVPFWMWAKNLTKEL